jgi:iron-sulfur cluster repair protein YtfE (RIC family)
MEGPEPLYDATLDVLQEYIARHIETEEKVLFPKVRKTGINLHRLALAIVQRRKDMTVELV